MRTYQYPSPLILKVSGRDAPRYMNARLSNDVRNLHIGDSCLAAALTAQGKTEGLFTIFKIDESEFILYCAEGDHGEVTAAFKRYIVADRVEVKDESSSWKLYHLDGELTDTDGFPGIISVAKSRIGKLGVDLLVPSDSPLPAVITDAEVLDWHMFETLRIAFGEASFPQELNSDTLFPESQLKTPIAFGKGCYVGQEVIEKVDAIGKLSKALRRVKVAGEEEIPPGSELRLSSTPTAVGKVISSSPLPFEGGRACFATLKTSLPKGTALEVHGRPVVVEEWPE